MSIDPNLFSCSGRFKRLKVGGGGGGALVENGCMEQLALAYLKVEGYGGMFPWKSFDFQTSGDAIYCITRIKMKLQ